MLPIEVVLILLLNSAVKKEIEKRVRTAITTLFHDFLD